MPQDPYAEFQIPASSPYAEFQAPKQQLGPPPGVPRPPNPIEQEIQYRATAPTAGLPGGSINPQPATDTMGMVAGGAIGAAALASPAVLPYTMSAIKGIPYVAAAEGINQARKHLPLGKYIPQGAELLPFLLGGKGKGAEAEEEAVATRKGAPLPERPPTSFLKANKPTYPGAPLPETPAPEVLNPALASEARTLPGQISAERIYGPRPPAPEAIAPRGVLALPGEVAPSAPQGGHAGGGVSSVEELSRPGQNYIVSKSGQLTYHGKSFAPEETPSGAAHVTVLPSGGMRVNAGTMNTTMQQSLEKALAGPNPYASSAAPTMEPVQSSNVSQIGHNGKHMWVEYKSGQVYQYKNVPANVYNEAKSADSVGSYISRNIKGKYGTSYRGTAPRGKAMAAD